MPSDSPTALPEAPAPPAVSREPAPSIIGAPPPAETDTLLGTTIGSFRVTRKLGVGGMGTVYLGEQPAIGSKVAIKVLHEHLCSNPSLVQRFYAEARAANVIGHEHIVSIIDLNVIPPSRYYFVMEYLEGKALNELNRPMAHPLMVHILEQCCDALQAAHTHGVVHRDLKPENIILTRRGRNEHFVKLLDFGIAKLFATELAGQQTVAGMIMGTPEFMAPEQTSGLGVDGRTDLYALGVIAYELATGRLPFTSNNIADLFIAHRMKQATPPHVLVPTVPRDFSAVVMKALAKSPEERFQTADELREALMATLEPEPPPPPRSAPSRSARTVAAVPWDAPDSSGLGAGWSLGPLSSAPSSTLPAPPVPSAPSRVAPVASAPSRAAPVPSAPSPAPVALTALAPELAEVVAPAVSPPVLEAEVLVEAAPAAVAAPEPPAPPPPPPAPAVQVPRPPGAPGWKPPVEVAPVGLQASAYPVGLQATTAPSGEYRTELPLRGTPAPVGPPYGVPGRPTPAPPGGTFTGPSVGSPPSGGFRSSGSGLHATSTPAGGYRPSGSGYSARPATGATPPPVTGRSSSPGAAGSPRPPSGSSFSGYYGGSSPSRAGASGVSSPSRSTPSQQQRAESLLSGPELRLYDGPRNAYRALPFSDLSRSGLFVHLEEGLPPVFSTVKLGLAGGGKELLVTGEVVRHVTSEQALAWNMPVGFAVQLSNLTSAQKEAIAAFIHFGTPSAVQADVPDDPRVDKALVPFRKHRGSSHYELLNVHEDADFGEVRQKVKDARKGLEELKARPLSAKQREDVDAYLARLDEAFNTVGNARNRLDYDGSRGNWKGAARCIAGGVSVTELDNARRRYLSTRERVEGSAHLHFTTASAWESQREYLRAQQEYERALALDPLNLTIHQRYQALRRVMTAPPPVPKKKA